MRICRVILVLGLLVCAGCGGSGETTGAGSQGSDAATAKNVSQQEPRYPVPAAAPQKKPLKKLVSRDLEGGGGPVARWGDTAIVRYVGVYLENGKIYSQHWGFSMDFELDGEAVGPGWQKGIEGMRVGGRRELLIPSDQLFGDGDLAYVVELLKVEPGPRKYRQEGPFSAVDVKGGGKDPAFDPPERPAPKKLLHRELEAGSGPRAERGDEVAIRYAGAMYENGEVRYGGTAGPFKLGAGGLGGAFERGIEGMRAGARRELIVPSRLLGGSGAVDYVIEMKRLEPASAQQEGG
jgi:peptidylprolyl isomerase